MNFSTYTPEIGKRYARVLEWTDSDEPTITIRPMIEGAEEEVEFEADETLDSSDLEVYEWAQVVGSWKLLQ
jgi:hypothetical protein